MSNPETVPTEPLTFNAVRQFIVSPDRYYRVELRRGALHFARTGTQFDMSHTGSVGRHQMSAKEASPPSALAAWGANASRSKLLGAGAGLIVLSAILIAITLAGGWVVGYLYLGLIFGFVLLLAGFVTPSDAQAKSRAHDFTLALSRLQSATLRLPERAGNVARLELQPLSDELIKLTISSHEDLETVKSSLFPVLGRKARIA